MSKNKFTFRDVIIICSKKETLSEFNVKTGVIRGISDSKASLLKQIATKEKLNDQLRAIGFAERATEIEHRGRCLWVPANFHHIPIAS